MLTGCRQLTHGAPRNFEQLKGKHRAPDLFWCSPVISSISWSSLSSWLHLRCLPGSFAMILEWKTNSEAKWKAIFFLMVNAIASQWAKGLSQSGLWIPITSCQPRPFHSFLFCSRIFAVFAASSWPWGWEVERTDLWKQKVGRAAMFRLEEWLLKYKIETVLLGRAGRGLVNEVSLTVSHSLYTTHLWPKEWGFILAF